MLRWSLIGEFYSFFILFILFLRYCWYERDAAPTRRRVLFTRCLLLAMSSIVLNTVCVISLDHPQALPLWCNYGLNTLYFFVSVCMCSFFAYLLFDATLEHVYDKHCLHNASVMLMVLTVISVLLLIANLYTGALFYIDQNGIYQRGPLNRVFYFLPLLELLFLFICFLRNRSSVGKRMLYVIRSLPPLILILVLLQLAYPNVLLNGTLCATVSLVIFIAFRTHTEERDILTGAGSRRAFISELELRGGSRQAVQFIQVTPLTMADINLQFTHEVGDSLLYEISHELSRLLPQSRLFRTANVTFTLMLPLKDEATAGRQLELVRQRLQKPWTLGELTVSADFAAAEMRCPELSDKPDRIMEQLEFTLSLAKENRGLVRFDETVRARLTRRSHLVELIRKSIAQKRFQVVYQPVFCCHDNVFCTAEALLRLSDDDGTPIAPDVFIPLAEEAGLVGELTWIVLEQVCQLLSSRQTCLESVSVNLSMLQLLDPELPARIRTYLERYKLEPNRLKAEITERFVLHDAQYAKQQLEALTAIGLELYMDDFGTGYSNLSSVLHHPFSLVKLDRSLIDALPENRQANMMVETLLQLFHNMNMRVVAEGAEEAVQAQHLKALGVDMIQGYYYARPMPEEDLITFLQNQ